MNHLIEILKEVEMLPIDRVEEYFEKNAYVHTGIYQLCKNCKHILVSHRHSGKETPIELGSCRYGDLRYGEGYNPCKCEKFV